MFKKPKCKKCNEKINKKYMFCPYCGFNQRDENSSEFFEPSFNLGFPFNMLAKKLLKGVNFEELEKQLKGLDSQPPTLNDEENENVTQGFPGGTMGVSINIDTKNGKPVIRIGNMNRGKKGNIPKAPRSNIPRNEISPEKAEKFSNLPKEEPETHVTRLTNKLVYEINLPGVERENIIIRKLESSIEIKAFSEEKSYFKLIPMSLPLLRSNLKEGKLFLELKL